MLYSIFICDRHFRILACFDHFLCLLRLDPFIQKMNRKTSVHGSCIYVNVSFFLCYKLRNRAFSGTCRSVYRHIISHGISPLFLFSILFICAFYSGSRRIRCRPGDLKIKSTRHCIQIQNLSGKMQSFHKS